MSTTTRVAMVVSGGMVVGDGATVGDAVRDMEEQASVAGVSIEGAKPTDYDSATHEVRLSGGIVQICEKPVAFWAEGDLVQAGATGTDAHDTGRVQRSRIANGREIATVAWDSQVTTDVDVDSECCDLRGIAVRERDAIRFGASR